MELINKELQLSELTKFREDVVNELTRILLIVDKYIASQEKKILGENK